VAKDGKGKAVAKKKGARMSEQGPRLTAAQKVKRDAELVGDKIAGMTWPEIAVKYKMSERGAQHVYYAWRDGAMENFAGEDALAIAFEFGVMFESMESQFAQLARDADNDSAKVGALRARLVAIDKRLKLYQATGRLPHDLGKLKVEIDVRHVSQVLIGVMEKYDMPIEARREVQMLLRGGSADNN
jgi:hypothetical protein